MLCSAMAGTKTTLGITKLLLSFFMVSFFKALGIQFSREAKERDAQVVCAFIPVSHLVYGVIIQFANLSASSVNTCNLTWKKAKVIPANFYHSLGKEY